MSMIAASITWVERATIVLPGFPARGSGRRGAAPRTRPALSDKPIYTRAPGSEYGPPGL
jgi:hypothetical protein